MLYDRVEQTTTTTGTGTLSLIAPSDASRRSFLQAANNGGQVYYCIETIDGTQYEYGIGTVTAGTPDTLTRTVIASSNGNALVNFPSGTKRVFCTLPAARSGIGNAQLPNTWGVSAAPSGWQRTPLGMIDQWGTAVITLDASGNGTIAWGLAFPNTVYWPVLSSGDMAASGNAVVGLGAGGSTLTGCAVSVRPNPGAIPVRINYRVMGW